MILSFSRALNPLSENSGIIYRLAPGRTCQDQEMLDNTVIQNISAAFWNNDLNFFPALKETFEILLGNHFDISLKGGYDCRGGSKGALDFFIFPLVARKLIADTFLEERQNSSFTNFVAWSIAVPLEITRVSAAIALTIILSPIVALVNLMKACAAFCVREAEASKPRLSNQ